MFSFFTVLSSILGYISNLKAEWIHGLMWSMECKDTSLELVIRTPGNEIASFVILTAEDNETLLNKLKTKRGYGAAVRSELKFLLNTGAFDPFLKSRPEPKTKIVKQVLEVISELDKVNEISQSSEYKEILNLWHEREGHIKKKTFLGDMYDITDFHKTESIVWINNIISWAYYEKVGSSGGGASTVPLSVRWKVGLKLAKGAVKQHLEWIFDFKEEMSLGRT